MPPQKKSSEKVLIFDSGTLISFAMNGLYEELRQLKKIFPGKFIITKEVKAEVIDKPIEIKRFELEALKLNELIDEGILESPSSLGIDSNEISNMTKTLMDNINNLFIGEKKAIWLIDIGETSCIALSKILSEKKIENVIAVDERTTRMLAEDINGLKKFLERKLHIKIEIKTKDTSALKNLKFIRSAELVYVAYKKGIIKMKGEKVLDALLYSMKFKGCSISDEEIDEIKRLG